MQHNPHQSLLLSLPAELRERIYHFFFFSTISNTTTTTRPIEPEILSTSKTIRREALPVYYSTLTLLIQSYIKVDIYGNTRIHYKSDCRFISLEALRWMKEFRLRYGLVQKYTGEVVPLEFQVRRRKRRGLECVVTHSFDRGWIRSPARTGDPADFQGIVEALREHIINRFLSVCERPGGSDFERCDLEQVLKIDPESLPI